MTPLKKSIVTVLNMTIKLKVLNSRNDGCVFHIEEINEAVKSEHFGKILISLRSSDDGNIIIEETIDKADLFI